MKKKKAIGINLLVIFIVLTVFMTVHGAAFTPASAYQKQERTMNYGPSETIATVQRGGDRFFLSKFRDYYSCGAVKRGFLGLWYGSKVGHAWGKENDRDKAVNYTIVSEREDDNGPDYIYGVINVSEVTSLEIEVLVIDADGELGIRTIEAHVADKAEQIDEIREVGVIYEDMFIAFIEEEGLRNFHQKKISAYSKDNQLVFEEVDPNAVIFEENEVNR